MKIQANSICKIINNIDSKEEIKTLIFVGGYCSNDILVQLIKNGLNKFTTYLVPSNPSLSIMEVAVLFGIEPSTISIRKAKYTIGKKINDFWDDKKRSEKGTKYFNKETQRWVSKDCFDKFIEINQNLQYEQEIIHSLYPATKTQIAVSSIFYKTEKTNPTFIFEEGMIKIGELRLVFGKDYENYEGRKIKTIMKFGGTFIDVTAIHIKSGKSVNTTLIFD